MRVIKEELFTVLGTCSSESVLPQMISKMEKAGVSKPVAGMIIPSGLTFNPDGQAIYYTIAPKALPPRRPGQCNDTATNSWQVCSR